MLKYFFNSTSLEISLKEIKTSNKSYLLFRNESGINRIFSSSELEKLNLSTLHGVDFLTFKDSLRTPFELNSFTTFSQALFKMKQSGISFKIANCERYFDQINFIQRRLSLGLKRLVTTNLYFSGPQSIVLPEHRDPYDILVLQIDGSKRWTIEGEKIELNVGDTLLLRKNALHYATSDEYSLHLTIGLKDGHDENSLRVQSINTALAMSMQFETINLQDKFKLNVLALVSVDFGNSEIVIESLSKRFKFNITEDAQAQLFNHLLNEFDFNPIKASEMSGVDITKVFQLFQKLYKSGIIIKVT